MKRKSSIFYHACAGGKAWLSGLKTIMLICKKNLFLIFITLALTSCIKTYEPEIAASDVNKLVVSGVVTDLGGEQNVNITTSASTNKPGVNPVIGCTVTISDSLGNDFPMADAGNGNYHGWIDPKYLVPGSSFKVGILTPDGSMIVSDYDRINACPEVDSVYFIRKDLPTINPEKFVKGIQFYVDLDGKNTDSHFYRWEAFETWEYHSDYPIEWYYDGQLHHISPPNYSRMICWLTLMVRNIFTISTTTLIENKYKLYPLNFVDNQTARLVYGYSLLVKQYAISEAAYNYWNFLSINSVEVGGLYERQPMAIKGNLHNLTHPDQVVLGFFGASSVKSKRIFVSDVPNLKIEYPSPCGITPLSPYGFRDTYPSDYPIYLVGDHNGWQPFILGKYCVDCLRSFGKNVKPDFWPY